MKGYGSEKRRPSGLIILFFVLIASFLTMKGISDARMVNCDPSVYDPATKTCIGVYCHSNGKGEYRPIKWDKNIPKLDCSSCHGAPPMNSQHREAKIETCGQKCHTQSISNGYTTDHHINGIVEGTYEGAEDGQCLSCHQKPQGGYPPIEPAFQMLSNHIGGPPTDYDCIVCHMEDKQEFHQNGLIELRNHQGGPLYTLEQYNQFCLGCHDLGDSVFGPNPFSTAMPIPSIHNELVSRYAQAGETVRFWYPHNHITGEGYDASQIMDQSGQNSLIYMNAPNHNNQMRLKAGMPMDLMGGGGMTVASPAIVSPFAAPVLANPILGGVSPMMIAAPTAALISSPAMGISPYPIMGGIAPVPMLAASPIMGGGITIMANPGPMIAVSSPMVGGGIVPGTGLISPALMGIGGGMPVGGAEVMNMIRSGPVNMIMGPGTTSLMNMDPMMGTGLFGMMPGLSSVMLSPVMGMPGMGMPVMGMPVMGMPMMGMPMPMMGMPGMGMPGMGGPMPMMGMPGMGMPGMGGPMPMMGMPGMGMPGMGGPMPGMGMPNPMTGMPGMNMPGPMNNNNLGPSHPTHPNDNMNNNPTNQNQPNNETNETSETTACIACHSYEDPDLLDLSVIINNFHGHFTHQNCIDCHAPHGSQFPGLLKEDINWNIQNKSCNVGFCHPTHTHTPPLSDTQIFYDIRPESICNTYSCHVGSVH